MIDKFHLFITSINLDTSICSEINRNDTFCSKYLCNTRPGTAINNPKAVVKTVSIKDAIDPIQTKEMESAPVQKAKPKAAKPKSAPVSKVKKTVEVELPNGDIEIREVEE